MAKQTVRADAPPPIEPPAVGDLTAPAPIVATERPQENPPPPSADAKWPDPSDPAVRKLISETSLALSEIDLMADAPRTGQWIEVTEDGENWVRVRWYSTRMRAEFAPSEVREKARNKLAWIDISCWSTSDPSRYRFRVQRPVAWRWPAERGVG